MGDAGTRGGERGVARVGEGLGAVGWGFGQPTFCACTFNVAFDQPTFERPTPRSGVQTAISPPTSKPKSQKYSEESQAWSKEA